MDYESIKYNWFQISENEPDETSHVMVQTIIFKNKVLASNLAFRILIFVKSVSMKRIADIF